MKQVFLLILSIACFYSCSDEELEGCTDPYAINFNGSAVKDDGSCQYAEEIRGCTNPLSDNYNPAATVDDGSCIISGCTDPEAENYDPLATIDDGSCITIDDREVFVGSWEVESDCGFQFPIAQQQEITIDSTTADSVLIAPFLQLGGGGVSAIVNGTTITIPEQTAGGFITYSAVGTINDAGSEIVLDIDYESFLGAETCRATYTKL